MNYFESGWNCLIQSLNSLGERDLQRTVVIRGESHSVPLAIARSITHISYHIGQIVLIARLVHGNENWNWITIAPGGSRQFNAGTWGTAAARVIAGRDQ